jgi:hypothetical protein
MAAKSKTPKVGTASTKAPKKAPKEPTYRMTLEVKNWIDQASSRIKFLTSEVQRLRQENQELKAYRAFAEQRILKSEKE